MYDFVIAMNPEAYEWIAGDTGVYTKTLGTFTERGATIGFVKLDPEGRFVLSDRLKAAIGLTDEATFVGQGDKFQIWAADAFAARLESARSRVRALRADLARAT